MCRCHAPSASRRGPLGNRQEHLDLETHGYRALHTRQRPGLAETSPLVWNSAPRSVHVLLVAARVHLRQCASICLGAQVCLDDEQVGYVDKLQHVLPPTVPRQLLHGCMVDCVWRSHIRAIWQKYPSKIFRLHFLTQPSGTATQSYSHLVSVTALPVSQAPATTPHTAPHHTTPHPREPSIHTNPRIGFIAVCI